MKFEKEKIGMFYTNNENAATFPKFNAIVGFNFLENKYIASDTYGAYYTVDMTKKKLVSVDYVLKSINSSKEKHTERKKNLLKYKSAWERAERTISHSMPATRRIQNAEIMHLASSYLKVLKDIKAIERAIDICNKHMDEFGVEEYQRDLRQTMKGKRRKEKRIYHYFKEDAELVQSILEKYCFIKDFDGYSTEYILIRVIDIIQAIDKDIAVYENINKKMKE